MPILDTIIEYLAWNWLKAAYYHFFPSRNPVQQRNAIDAKVAAETGEEAQKGLNKWRR
jgi:hypothetical protein